MSKMSQIHGILSDRGLSQEEIENGVHFVPGFGIIGKVDEPEPMLMAAALQKQADKLQEAITKTTCGRCGEEEYAEVMWDDAFYGKLCDSCHDDQYGGDSN